MLGGWMAHGHRGPVLPRSRKTQGCRTSHERAGDGRPPAAGRLLERRGEEQPAVPCPGAHELQEAFGEMGRGLIVATRETVALSLDGVWIDARELPLMARDRVEALNLLQGELLADLDGLDDAFDAWLLDQRRRLREAALEAASLRLAAATSPEARAEEARRVLAIDAAQEPVWRTLIRAEAERGDRGAAFAAWEECRRVFSERFRGTPSPETAALAESLRGEAPAPAARPSAQLGAPRRLASCPSASRQRPRRRGSLGLGGRSPRPWRGSAGWCGWTAPRSARRAQEGAARSWGSTSPSRARSSARATGAGDAA